MTLWFVGGNVSPTDSLSSHSFTSSFSLSVTLSMASFHHDAPNVLSQEQREQFAADGFLAVENFFTEEEAALFSQYSNDLEHMPDVKGSIWKYWNMQKPVANDPGARFLDRIENFCDFHEGWKNLFERPESKLVRAVSELFGEDAVLWKEKLNFKKPGSSGFAPHQDAQVNYFFL